MEDKKEFEILKSEELKEIVTAIPHWILRKGNTLILLVILISIVFSYFIKYPETIISEAIITTLDPPQKIYTNVSGKIDRIFVENNDLVKNSQPIALIENSAEYNDVTLLQKTINDFNINIENIYSIILILQGFFYFSALIGKIFEKSKIKLNFIFIPYYLLIMNYSQILGFIRHLLGKQTVL